MSDATQRFTLLYDQHHPRVLAYARSRASREVAEEVASATFLVAWQRLDEVPAPALPWLLGVARNLIRGHYARAGRQQATVADLATLALSQPPAGDVGEVVAERTAMLAALSALPAAYQEALTLVAWHGLTAAEAATVVGCSRAAFFVRLHRARRRLEAALDQGPRPAPAAGGRPRGRHRSDPLPSHPAAAAKAVRPVEER